MAKRIPITIDADVKEFDATTSLWSMVPADTNSIVTGSGKIIRAGDFSSYRAADIPEGFDTQTATINKAGDAARLLARETALVNWWLSGFEPCPMGSREAFLNDTGDFIGIRNFPLPDAYQPDQIHLCIYVSQYPTVPPIGLYLATGGANRRLIEQIKSKVNVFSNNAFHGAEKPLPGFEWVCLVAEGWRVNHANMRKGQNIQKYLGHFYALLGE